MKKQSGLSIIEMMFTLFIIGIIGVWSTSVFYNLQKTQHEKDVIRTMQEQKTALFNVMEKDIQNNFSNLSIENEAMKIKGTTNGCSKSLLNATYKIVNDDLYCNDKILHRGVKKLNILFGYDENNDGVAERYTLNETIKNGDLISLTIEIILKSEEKFFKDKEKFFMTLEGEQLFVSNHFLQIYRTSIVKEVY